MYFIVIIIFSLVIKFHSNYVSAASYPEPLRISAKELSQTFTLEDGDKPTIFRIYDVRSDIEAQFCRGNCTINGEKRNIIFNECNVVEANGLKHFNILIRKTVSKYFAGDWKCTISGSHVTDHSVVAEYPQFKIFIIEPDYSTLFAKLPLPAEPPTVEFNITSPDQVSNFSLVEGEQNIMMTVSGLVGEFPAGICSALCDINRIQNITESNCAASFTDEQKKVIYLQLQKFEVTPSHNGPWNCDLYLPQHLPSPLETGAAMPPKRDPQVKRSFKVTVAVKPAEDKKKQQLILFIIIFVVILVILIIIGQTICILYFKSKARRAEIDKNLTLKNDATNTVPETRYTVKKNTGPSEVNRDSQIYEALEAVRDLAPPLPPIETMPVTPKVSHMMRSASQNNLSLKADAGVRTTPRQLPKNPQNLQHPRKFNTVDRSSSIERIRNRAPLPIPTEIYEVMASDDTTMTPKTRVFESKISQEQTPLLKKKQFGKNKSSPEGPKSTGPTGRQGPISSPPGRKVPGPSRVPAPEQNTSVPGRSMFGPTVSLKPPTGSKPVMGAMPVLPSMITAANLKPVKQAVRPPVAESPKTPPQKTSLDYPSPKSRPLPTTPRPQLSLPSVETESENEIRTKAPMPLPKSITPEPPLIPTEEPQCYDSSSDEEFKCYDDLSQYRIYGNTQPKKYK